MEFQFNIFFVLDNAFGWSSKWNYGRVGRKLRENYFLRESGSFGWWRNNKIKNLISFAWTLNFFSNRNIKLYFIMLINWKYFLPSVWNRRNLSAKRSPNCDVSVKIIFRLFVMKFYGVLILTVAPKQRDPKMHPSRLCAVDYLLIVCKNKTNKIVIAIINAYLLYCIMRIFRKSGFVHDECSH